MTHSNAGEAKLKRTELGVLPCEWAVVSLSKLEPFVTSGSRGWAAFYSDQGDLFVRITNLSRESIYLNLDDRKFVKLTQPSGEGARTRLQEHDVLISITADIGIVGYVDSSVPSPAYINQHIALVRFDAHKTCGKFVSYFLASARSQVLFRAATDTGAKAGMSLPAVLKIQTAVPPVREQRAIAEALSDVDALLAGLDRLIAKKRDLKQAAMQQLLTGQTRLPGFETPWLMKRLDAVADIDPESLGGNTRQDFTFNYIALEDVDKGMLRSYSAQTLVGAPSRARRKLRPGDLLVSTVRPNLQSHLLFDVRHGNWVCSTGFCVVRCHKRIADPAYVFAHLFGSSIAQQIDVLLTGSNYPAINSRDVRSLEIAMPDYTEQAAIAAVLFEMESEVGALVARRDKTRAIKLAMMQELLTGRIRLI